MSEPFTEAITYPLPEDWRDRQFWRTYDRTRWRHVRCCEVETHPGCYNGNGTVFERVTDKGAIRKKERTLWTTLCLAEHIKAGHLRFVVRGAPRAPKKAAPKVSVPLMKALDAIAKLP